MSAIENKQLLQHIFAELSKGNSHPFVDNLADDVSWTVIGTTRWSRTYSGKSAVLKELLRPLGEKLDGPYAATAHRFIAEGDYVAVESRGSATTKTGKPYNNTYCFILRIEGGRIREVTEYMDTQLATSALDG